MIDYFSIGLTHALLALVAWRLLMRSDLDHDGDVPDRRIGARRQTRRDNAETHLPETGGRESPGGERDA
ncbi:hypothetical protein NT2_04_01420 [Caenibius tardaugens NBRC 16725]|uniref:Uncharacterized protein n=1 Tax=Caenibius tardaugens NBRC 16725 TaxID=1219035 RepID=U2Y6D7_9SPHN|nr:hypothetical protein [Caenibius tardaugens]AZI36178.1 hypothetical protein EGO55_09575 [Caenibius tardaugens NBRC 16725]GAD48731.1 hypothetical protein NT2_04_01420 [Caenibius tardaugens NBRC 16725]